MIIIVSKMTIENTKVQYFEEGKMLIHKFFTIVLK